MPPLGTGSAMALALAAGAMLPMQGAINARLGRAIGSSIWAAAVSGAVLTLALLVLGIATTRGLPRMSGGAAPPWWAWTGGLCGMLVLSATAATIPRLGAATMVALVVGGQVLFAVLIDRFGLFGLPSSPLTPRRVLAVCLLLSGAALTRP